MKVPSFMLLKLSLAFAVLTSLACNNEKEEALAGPVGLSDLGRDVQVVPLVTALLQPGAAAPVIVPSAAPLPCSALKTVAPVDGASTTILAIDDDAVFGIVQYPPTRVSERWEYRDHFVRWPIADRAQPETLAVGSLGPAEGWVRTLDGWLHVGERKRISKCEYIAAERPLKYAWVPTEWATPDRRRIALWEYSDSHIQIYDGASLSLVSVNPDGAKPDEAMRSAFQEYRKDHGERPQDAAFSVRSGSFTVDQGLLFSYSREREGQTFGDYVIAQRDPDGIRKDTILGDEKLGWVVRLDITGHIISSQSTVVDETVRWDLVQEREVWRTAVDRGRPLLSPNQAHVLLVGHNAVHVLDVDSGRKLLSLPNTSQAIWTVDGRVAYLDRTHRMRVRSVR